MVQRIQTIPRTLALIALVLFVPAAMGAQMNFEAQLAGGNEVPPVDTDAFGSCVGILSGLDSPAMVDLSFELSCEHNVSNPIAAHIHRGFAGENGPVIFDLSSDDDDLSDSIQATWEDIDFEHAIRLIAGGHYVNIHTAAHPGGVIRGQLLVVQPDEDEPERMTFPLEGQQEVPAVSTSADGSCVAWLETEPSEFAGQEGTLDLFCEHTVENPTAAHIHLGDRGVAGPILIDLGGPESPMVVEDIELDSVQLGQLRTGDLYVNVHSTEFPGGEIRGQMDHCLASKTRLCLLGDRFSVEATFETVQGGGRTGDAVGVRQTDETGTFWFFRPSNQEIFLKMLRGCGINGHFWVFSSATTNVGYEITVTDERTNETRTYENDDLTAAEPILDTDAFMTCP